MANYSITTFDEYLKFVNQVILNNKDIVLFRGQNINAPLLPSIARKDNKIDTTDTEKEMLDELKRRSKLILNHQMMSDWDWLIYAQHYGMKTRLLDWTSNPLNALWFALNQANKTIDAVYVYILSAPKDYLVDSSATSTPFDFRKTKILKPVLNNERIIAQSGWFTAHKYSKTSNMFVPLNKNKETLNMIHQITIPNNPQLVDSIFKILSMYGVNNQSLFPDITGLCGHLNWSYDV